LGAIVLGVLQSSTWGLIEPKDSPIAPLGFSLTIYVIGAGLALLWLFVLWQRRREARGEDPLVHLDLLRIPPLRSGLANLLAQNLILMGIFFVVPLYLQMVLGLDALETGIKMLPVSVTMFIASALGSRLSLRYSVRTIVRAGLVTIAAALVILIATIDPELRSLGFAASMALLGVGMGLLASQLGNVVQSSVGASGRSEAGGLQYTGQQLGSSLGVALIGAIVLAGLTSNFLSTVETDERISAEVATAVSVAVDGSVEFVATDDVVAALDQAGLDAATSDAILDDYQEAQLHSLKTGLLAALAVALLTLVFTGALPSRRPEESLADGLAPPAAVLAT
jgi:Na+/melibiose symporter-like transporter